MTKAIIVIVLLFVVFIWSFYKSLVYLKSKSAISTYYEFDLKMPGTTAWGVAFYLIIIVFLLISAYLFMHVADIVPPPA